MTMVASSGMRLAATFSLEQEVHMTATKAANGSLKSFLNMVGCA